MKLRKVLVVVLSVVSMCGVIFSAKPYDIQAQIKNAIQHIQFVQLLNGNYSVDIKGEQSNVKITDTINFLLTGNTIDSSSRSNVLGGIENKLLGLSGGTILGGENNIEQSNYSVINGGDKNIIDLGSEGSIILGGIKNKVNQNSVLSVIVGGSNNEVEGKNSIVAGKNSSVLGSSSVALGSDVIVRGSNSFFWSDGSISRELSGDSVFVVVSENGMVINTGRVHTGAQLTLNGSLVVSQQTGANIRCESGFGAGIMVLTGKIGSNQKCLCSCDGYAWHSLVGNGQCETVCNGTSNSEPRCGTGLSVVKNGSGQWDYLGSCEKGFPIENSYRVTRYQSGDIIGDKVQWVCQENNGSATYSGCEYIIKCEGTITGLGISKKRNNTIIPSLDPNVSREYKYNDDPSVLCSYSCMDGYVWTGGDCKSICNTGDNGCYIGTRVEGDTKDWFSGEYYYNCNYEYGGNSYTQACKMKCDGGKVWNGTGCVEESGACGSSKYSCNFGTPSKTSMDEEDRVGKYFTWSCNNGYGTPIGGGCKLNKTEQDKNVYYNIVEAGNIKTVRFSLDGSLSGLINIKLNVNYGWYIDVNRYSISANTQLSEKKNYNVNVSLGTPNIEPSEIVQGETVYKLKILSGNTAGNHCASSCSMAGQCLHGVTPSDYNSSINGNQMNFTWKCGTQSCSASCRINTSSCSAKPSGSTWCDATTDSECVPLSSQTITIKTGNFYMYSADEVISSSVCGTKRHCIKGSSGYVNCTNETNYCWQNGFKCDNGKVLSGCNCVNVCTSSSGVGKCNGGATATLPGATWTTGYNYTCTLRSNTYNCSATCSSGKYWGGSVCVIAPSVCGSTHYNCMNGARMTENVYSPLSHSYNWRCILGDINKQCIDCEDGYILSGSSCIPTTLGCNENYNLNGYRVPAMSHGESKTVTRVDSIQKCTSTATCMNSSTTLGTENCTVACNKTTNPGTCNLGLSVTNRTGTKWGYSYTYKCGDFACGVTCDTGKIWNGSKCVDKMSPPCSGTANQCVQGIPENKTSSVAGDTWNCLDARGDKINTSGVCYKCKQGYIWNGNRCAKSCKTSDNVDWVDGNSGYVYKGTGYTCPSDCNAAKINVKCDNGKFVSNVDPYDEVTVPVYNSCVTTGVLCSSTIYTLTSCPEGGNCSLCIGYTVSNNSCPAGNVKYKLDSCNTGYTLYQPTNSVVTCEPDLNVTAYVTLPSSFIALKDVKLTASGKNYFSSNCSYLQKDYETCSFTVPYGIYSGVNISATGVRDGGGKEGYSCQGTGTITPDNTSLSICV